MLSILPYKEEEEGAKAETEEKIIDPNGDEVFVTAAKHIIEYCITSHYPTISDLLGGALLFFRPGVASVRGKHKT